MSRSSDAVGIKGLNRSANFLLQIQGVQGPVAKMGSVTNAFEVTEFFMNASANVAVGATGVLQKNSVVSMSHLMVSLIIPSNLPTIMQDCFLGKVYPTVELTVLGNIVKDNQTIFTIKLTNARVSLAAYNAYRRDGKPLKIRDIYGANTNFTPNRDLLMDAAQTFPRTDDHMQAVLRIAYDEVAVTYTEHEDSGTSHGKVSTTINLTNNTAVIGS